MHGDLVEEVLGAEVESHRHHAEARPLDPFSRQVRAAVGDHRDLRRILHGALLSKHVVGLALGDTAEAAGQLEQPPRTGHVRVQAQALATTGKNHR